MSEILYDEKIITPGYCFHYQVEREIKEEEISIIVYNVGKGKYIENSKVSYKNIGEEYESPFLSWYNLYFCSAQYGVSTNYEYMDRAVQEGKKTAATLYHDRKDPKRKEIIENLPDDCRWAPYSSAIFYVYHRGRLKDFFEFEEIKHLYEKHEAGRIDWDKVQEYFKRTLGFFSKEERCGFSLQGGAGAEETIIKGLLLGYPIESTVGYVRMLASARSFYTI